MSGLDGLGGAMTSAAAIATTVATVGGAIALSAVRSRKKHHSPSLMGIDHDGEMVIPEQALQWWPAEINDAMGVGWNTKAIPGGSHAVMQWGGNEGRTFNFEFKLSRNMRYLEDFAAAGPFGDMPLQAKLVNPDGPRNLASNVDIIKMVKYLRAYCYPAYDSKEGGIALPPVTALLNVPGLSLNEDGGDTIWCVVTACDVTYHKAFRDGKPRLASVAMSFKQIVQDQHGVHYKSREDLLEAVGIFGGDLGAGLAALGLSGTIPVARELNATEITAP